MSFEIGLSVLGLASGAATTCSALPQLWANFKDASLAQHQSAGRNLLLMAGNAGWFAYSCFKDVPEMTIFSTLGFCMAAYLWVQVLRARVKETDVRERSFPLTGSTARD